MSNTLCISPSLSLPLEAVTQTFAILAKRGVGKTYTAAVLAEEMLQARLQVVVLDSQRAAVVNKDVLTRIEVLVALRTISPQDRRAVQAWVEAHDALDQQREFLASLASLPVGTAWFWSPGWLELFKRVGVRRRETFDSSATPKLGEKLAVPGRLAEVDLERIRGRIAASIPESDGDDPAALRGRISALERRLRDRAVPEPVVEGVEVGVLTDADRSALERLAALLEETRARLDALDGELGAVLERVASADVPGAEEPAPGRVSQRLPGPVAGLDGEASGGFTAAELATLSVLAQYLEGLSRPQLTALAGYSAKDGAFNRGVAVLASRGLIMDSKGHLEITREGRGAIPDGVALPTRGRQAAYWLGALSQRAQRNILRALLVAYPRALSRELLGAATGYSVTAGAFAQGMAELRALGLIEGRGDVRASGEVFG